MSKSVPATVPATNVVGYYNAAKWPIQLVISKLNITLFLQPGEYILDRRGRKINDPFFEVYANSKQLQREVSDKAVPIITVPVIKPIAPANDGLSVRSVTEFKEDEKGLRQPVLPTPQAVPEQAANKAPIKAMTMEEARRGGFIKKIREVPEDFGVKDTDGAPVALSEVPTIRYSIDPSMLKRPADLPQELLQMPEDIKATRAPLIAQLAKAETTNAALDSATGFMNVVSRTAPPGGAPVVAGKPVITESAPAPAAPTPPAPPAPPVSTPVTTPPAEPEATGTNVIPDIELPAPDLTELEEGAESVTAGPESDVEEAPAAEAPTPASPVTQRPGGAFECPVCHTTRKVRALFEQHVKSKHPDQYAAIMSHLAAT